MLNTAISVNSSATSIAPSRESVRYRAKVPLPEKYSIRICRSRATAAELPTKASTVIKKIENSSVQANDWSVK